jgi:hypothetical protein
VRNTESGIMNLTPVTSRLRPQAPPTQAGGRICLISQYLIWNEIQKTSKCRSAAAGLNGAPDIRDRPREYLLRSRQAPPDMERPACPLTPLAQRGIAYTG